LWHFATSYAINCPSNVQGTKLFSINVIAANANVPLPLLLCLYKRKRNSLPDNYVQLWQWWCGSWGDL